MNLQSSIHDPRIPFRLPRRAAEITLPGRPRAGRKPKVRPTLVRARGGDALAIREDGTGSTSGPVLEGYGAVFGVWAEISDFEGHYLERVARGAFKRTLHPDNRANIKCQLSHGRDPEVGDRPIGRFEELKEDEHGLYYRVRLFPGLPEMVLEGLRAGEYGASFRFNMISESFDPEPGRSHYNPEGLPERVLHEVKLHELGPVVWGAYKEASAGIRAGAMVSLSDEYRRTTPVLDGSPSFPSRPKRRKSSDRFVLP